MDTDNVQIDGYTFTLTAAEDLLEAGCVYKCQVDKSQPIACPDNYHMREGYTVLDLYQVLGRTL